MEGILPTKDYHSLFETALKEFGQDHIWAYYYDLPFEETLARHSTKPNRDEFGEPEMRKWWREKDYINIIPEKLIHKEESLEDTVERIYQEVIHD